MVASRDRALYRHASPTARARSICLYDRAGAARQCRRSAHGALQPDARMAGAGRLVWGRGGGRLRRGGLLEGAAAGGALRPHRLGRVAADAASFLWGVAAALLAASLAIEFAHDRPSILSYVFTAAFIAIFEDRRRLWILPPLAIVWANSHGGFFLGWIVCGAYARRCVHAPLARLAAGALSFGTATVIVSGINPNGFAAIATVLTVPAEPDAGDPDRMVARRPLGSAVRVRSALVCGGDLPRTVLEAGSHRAIGFSSRRSRRRPCWPSAMRC